MDTDAEPSVFSYVLSFLLVGVAWGFTTPFIRRAAADFNARQDELKTGVAPQHKKEEKGRKNNGSQQQRNEPGTDTKPEAEGRSLRRRVINDAKKNGNANEDEMEEDTSISAERDSVSTSSSSPWLQAKIGAVFWTVANLLRTPAYSIPLVVNLTGSVWFFLLVGKHELSLTVPLANSSAFLFTVLGEWYVERKVIAKETWLGMALVLGGIALCVHSKNQTV